ncbi:MAG: LETM1-related biofilm-associated protein [Flavobacteriaceae bacterium]|nr:LETM1-related biofilm-associated protein [Flavobacteriaceae bacterium]
MNPSASGWIEKYGALLVEQNIQYPHFEALYNDLRATGFIYGINVAPSLVVAHHHELTKDEIAKINLLHALYNSYHLLGNTSHFPSFLDSLLDFYKALDAAKNNVFFKLLSGNSAAASLEKLLHNRVLLSDNKITKHFQQNFINALLFVEVLTFKQYLRNPSNIKDYGKQLEEMVILLTYHALENKPEGNAFDGKLNKIFNASLNFLEHPGAFHHQNYQLLLRQGDLNPVERQYFLDLACFLYWNKGLEFRNNHPIIEIGTELGFSGNDIELSFAYIHQFLESHQQNIAFLQEKSPVNQVYDNLSALVKKLIIRNKRRLQLELSESKELLYLIGKSAQSELEETEKKKIKKQLLDLFKTIPSFAIFAMPGGAILLPIFVKLIPKLLPSAFDDNRIEKKE